MVLGLRKPEAYDPKWVLAQAGGSGSQGGLSRGEVWRGVFLSYFLPEKYGIGFIFA